MRSHLVLWAASGLCLALGVVAWASGQIGLGSLGVLLALALGAVALIMSFINAGKRRCSHCESRMRKGASVCPKCGREATVRAQAAA